MSGRLTTHVLDTARGRPAAGVEIAVHRDGVWIRAATTGADGRPPEPLIEGESFVVGVYELIFRIGDYFADVPGFLGEVPVRFTVTDASTHYHVPLLVSPFGYSTYRGS